MAATVALTAAALTPESADPVAAQRPVEASYALGFGASQITDTYLSPLTYSGWSSAFSYRRRQTTPFDDRWQYRLDVRVALDRTDAPRGSAVIWGTGIEAQWGMARRWSLPGGITLAVGPALGVDLGCLYSTANGNNPVSAKAAVTLNATGTASWRTRIGRLPVTVSYQPTLPVIGAFFAPEYDELYYEIYLGNRHGLAHCAWWGNRFKISNLVAVDLHLSNTALRIGFDATALSSEVNHITANHTTWRLVIGVSGNWLSVPAPR